jgi:hypothetical protein
MQPPPHDASVVRFGRLCVVDPRPSVHLLRSAERVDAVEALVARLGGRVGLPGILADLNRTARRVRVPARAASWGFTWDRADSRTRRWWPQGITTSADAGDREDFEGRSVLITSAYSHDVDGVHKGARVSFVDLNDRAAIRYRHVLLVEPFLRDDGEVDVRPVKVHAGGLVWHGDYLHVAGTTRGFSSFRLDDVVAAPAGGARDRLGLHGGRLDTFGYRYLLPVRFTYDAHTGAGAERMRYSFASVDRSASPHEVVVGEYGRDGMSTRLARFPIDPETSLLGADPDGRSHPLLLEDAGVQRMQGATVVHGTWFVTSSRGRFGQGSVWVGRPGRLREHKRQLPVGPEDIAYWPSRDELWSVSEYPHERYVFAMPRGRFVD